ncbi:hypothetical protein ACFL6E_06415 [Candidatus Neomarinimicrobiota bacterium]
MLRLLLLVILPVAIYSTSMDFGRTPIDDPVEQQVWRGINAMYSYKHDLANAIFDSVLVMDPENIPAPLLSAVNRWLQSIVEIGAGASHDTLYMVIDQVIPHYERLLTNSREQEALTLLFLGTTYGLRARVAVGEKRWLSIIYSGFRGWQIIKRAYALNPDLKDAYLPIGIFEYYAGVSSTPVQWMARMAGIKADRKAGLEKMDLAVREGQYSWIESASTIAIIYLYLENDPQAAAPYTTLLMNAFPENYYFNILYGEQLVQLAPVNVAQAYLDSLEPFLATAHENQQLEWALKLATLRARLYYRTGQYDQALLLSNWVIANYAMEFDWHLGIALYIRGKIKARQGNRDVARIDFLTAISLDNQTYIIREAKQALKELRGF